MPDLKPIHLRPLTFTPTEAYFKALELLVQQRATILELRRAWQKIPHEIQVQEALIVQLRSKLAVPTAEDRRRASRKVGRLRKELYCLEDVLGEGRAGTRHGEVVSRITAIHQEMHDLEGRVLRGHIDPWVRMEIEGKVGIAETEVRSLLEKREEIRMRAWVMQEAMRYQLRAVLVPGEPAPRREG